MRKGNKGEWSELYTFIKLLTDGKLYAADEHLNIIPNIYYPIIKVLKWEKGRELEYFHTNQMIILEDQANSHSVKMPISEFKDKSLLLLHKIKTSKGSSFEVSDIEDFLNSIKFGSLKAESKDKSDIRVKVHDPFTGMNPILGFSIKSRIGKAPTLLNPGKSTNFIYKISGSLDDNDMQDINNINTGTKIRDRMKAIEEKNCTLEFSGVSDEMFNLNLQVIDSSLPQILAILLKYYFSGRGKNMNKLIELIKKENPLKYNSVRGHDFYEYKIKSFMRDVALGMTPTKMWSGLFDATGGFIVVKEDGEILCYHIYNHNEFQDYLFQNVRFDSPSSSRYKYGEIYKENGLFYFKLNIQLRFI